MGILKHPSNNIKFAKKEKKAFVDNERVQDSKKCFLRACQAPNKLLRPVFFEKLEINYCHPLSPSITHGVHRLHICYQFTFPPFYNNCLVDKK